MQGRDLESCRDMEHPTPALHEAEPMHDSGSELSRLLDSPAAAAALLLATQDTADCLDVDSGQPIACSLSDLRQRMQTRRKLEACTESVTVEQQHAFAAASLQVKLSEPLIILALGGLHKPTGGTSMATELRG